MPNGVRHLLRLGLRQLAAKPLFAYAHPIKDQCQKLPLTVMLKEIICKTAATAWYLATLI
jgi:hypothetical protein